MNISLQQVFESLPQRYLVLNVDTPRFTIIAATDAYCQLVMKTRDELIGQGLFEVFPQADIADDDDGELSVFRESLNKVLRDKKNLSLADYRFDMPDIGQPNQFFERYWHPSIIPLLNDDGEVNNILLAIDEATDFVLRERYIRQRYADDKVPYEIGGSVLVIDPDESWNIRLSQAFSTYWQVESAINLEQGLQTIKRQKPDVIVIAMEQAMLRGAMAIKALKLAGDFRLVVRVESTDGRRYREAFEAGADDVVSGFASTREFLARVHTQFSQLALQNMTRTHVERQYRHLFMQAPFGISLMEGPDHIFTLSNPAFDQMSDHRQLIGLSAREVFTEPDLQPLLDRVDEVYRHGTSFSLVEAPVQLQGRNIHQYFTFSYLPLRDSDDNIYGVATFAMEVTEQVKARALIQQENDRINTFLAMLGHELRNPLAPIVNANEVLSHIASSADQETIVWATDIIRRQVGQLTHHVDDLLDVARIKRGRVIIERKPANLNDIIIGAIEAVQGDIDQRNQRLIVKKPEKNICVDVDAHRITQIISNLLTNASRYSPDSSKIWIDVTTPTVNGQDWLSIIVKDEGEGIAPEALPEIFGLFVQAHATIDRSKGGLGLGLPLVNEIAQLHGGHVEAFSDGPGKGSRFVVEIPIIISEFEN